MTPHPRHGVPVFTATRHDQIAVVPEPTCAQDRPLLLVQLGSPLDRHQFLLTVAAAAQLRAELDCALDGLDRPIPREDQ